MALQITQIRSINGAQGNQIRTLQSLGLKRIRHTVVVPDRPEIRGMAHKVTHMVTVEEVSDDLLPGGGRSRYRDRGQGPIESQEVPLAEADVVEPDGDISDEAASDTDEAASDTDEPASDEEE